MTHSVTTAAVTCGTEGKLFFQREFGALILVLATQLPARAAQQCVFVANYESDTLSVIDDSAERVVSTIAVGTGVRPFGITILPDGSAAYVANRLANTVSAIDMRTNAVRATIPVPAAYDVAATPDGRSVYVTSIDYAGSTDAGSVSVIDTRSNAVTATISVTPGPVSVAVTPDGAAAYVTSFLDAVSVIDTRTNTVAATIPIDGNHHGLATSPDGRTVYVENRRTVSVVDTATHTVTATIQMPFGDDATGIAITPDGAFAYVAVSGYPGGVVVVDTGTRKVVTTISIFDPLRVAISPDGSRAYVTSNDSSTLSVVDMSTKTVIDTIPVQGVQNVALSPDGSFAYITTGGDVVVMSTATNAVLATISAASPTDVAISFDGRRAYVTNSGLGTVAVIELPTGIVSANIPVTTAAGALGRIALSRDGGAAFVPSNPYGQPGAVALIDTITDTIRATVLLDGPQAVAVAPDGRFAYVLDASGVAVIDTSTATVTQTIDVSDVGAGDIAVTPDGATLYVTAACGGVCVVDTATRTIRGSIAFPPLVNGLTPASPVWIAVTPDGQRAYVAVTLQSEFVDAFIIAGAVFVIHTDTNSIDPSTTIALDRPANIIAVTPDGERVYVPHSLDDTVSVIDTQTNTVIATLPVGSEPFGVAAAVVPGGCGAQEPAPTHTATSTPSAPPAATPTATPPKDRSGSGCSVGPGPSSGLAAMVVLALSVAPILALRSWGMARRRSLFAMVLAFASLISRFREERSPPNCSCARRTRPCAGARPAWPVP